MQLYKYESLPKIDINDDESVDRYIEFCKKIFPKNRRTIKRTVAPKFLNYQQQEVWEMEEIRKIIEGDGILCGKMYFYFNYCKIKHTKEGTIRPEFRVPDNEWFRLVESCDQGKENQGKGIICLKARRGGFSWKEAADVIHDAILNTGITIGMNANSEASSRDLFSKVKFIYDNLPNFLRPSVDGGKSRDHIKFGIKTKDEFGNSITEGHNSEIFCVAPTDSAFEGRALRKWVFDEVGKTKNSLAMFSLTEPCLELGRERVGVPIFFGTAGEIEKGAMGQHEFFMKHEVYNLERFLFAGWMDKCDKFGNPMIEENVWSIINTRRRLLEANAMTKYLDALQQYPLNSSEALMSKEGHGIGNVKNIQLQLDTLTEHIVKHEVGYFTWGQGEGGEQIAVWNPDPVKGTVHMWERPRRELHKGYVCGIDPADHDYVNTRASDLSTMIIRKQVGSEPPKLVCSYTDRPNLVDDYYEQAALALIYYNETKCLIEDNRYGMIKWFKSNGLTHLLKPTPIDHKNVKQKYIPRYGIRKTEQSGKEMERCINEYTDQYIEGIYDIELLKEFKKYGTENTDRVIAFGWACVSLQDEYRPAQTMEQAKTLRPNFMSFKKVGGKIVRR